MLLIKNAEIKAMSNKCISSSEILIDGKFIKDIGIGLMYDEAKTTVIDAKGMIVCPGFIDAHSHIGLTEQSVRFEGDDRNETSDPITPHLRSIDGINPECLSFKEALEAGVTTAAIGAGSSNPIGGDFTAFKLYGNRIDDMIIKSPVAIKASLGENPKKAYGQNQNKAPTSRMTIASMIRNVLDDAVDYQLSNNRKKNLKLEALIPVLNKEIPLKVHANALADIHTAMRIAEEYNINITIEHGAEAPFAAEALAKANIAVCVGSLLTYRNSYEQRKMSFETPKLLAQKGVKFALVTDCPTTLTECLPLIAGLSVREGLPEEDAWKAVTINPAEILGISDRVGSLEVGKDADIVIFDQNPLRKISAKAMMTIVNGKIVYSDSSFMEMGCKL